MPFKMHDEGQIHKLLFYYWSHLAIFNELKFAGHARSLFFFQPETITSKAFPQNPASVLYVCTIPLTFYSITLARVWK